MHVIGSDISAIRSPAIHQRFREDSNPISEFPAQQPATYVNLVSQRIWPIRSIVLLDKNVQSLADGENCNIQFNRTGSTQGLHSRMNGWHPSRHSRLAQ